MALSAPRNVPRRSTYYFEADAPVGAAAVLWQGALSARNAAGYLVPFTATTGLKNPCIVDSDNLQLKVTGGAANGDVQARIFFGVFPFKNVAGSGGADTLTEADVGKVVYGLDDETVVKTDRTGTLSAAGKLDRIDADGFWVSLARP
jgi:hypothetical protein